MKKFLSIALSVVMLFALLAGCGSKDAADTKDKKDDKKATIEGKYIAVSAEMMGMVLVGEDVEGWSMEIKGGGKGVIELDGDGGEFTYTLKDDKITIKIEEDGETAEMTGTVGVDKIVFDEMLGMEMKITFAKEGSETAKKEAEEAAAKAAEQGDVFGDSEDENDSELSEEEEALVGIWTSDSVTNAFSEDASAEIDPAAMMLTLNDDKSAVLSYKGEVTDGLTWSYEYDFGQLQGFDDLHFELNEDGSVTVTYYKDNDYYEFHCVK